ncbi:MAG: hypothetical protein OEY77_09580, partial [Nitrospira sp.]|nr:hypothetical protein [Nitrospira sp.]
MTWEQLVVPVLLVLALVAQLMRVWKQRGFEQKEEEADREVITRLQESKRTPVREPHGSSEQPDLTRPATEALTTRCLRTSHIDLNTRSMRRGIIMMTILEPCRGVNPFEFHG